VNGAVQGSAADIVRRASLAARDELLPTEAQLLINVHDELMWERGPDWIPAEGSDDDSLSKILWACEEGHGFEMDVPIVFEVKEVKNWAEKGDVGGVIRSGEFATLEDAAMT